MYSSAIPPPRLAASFTVLPAASLQRGGAVTYEFKQFRRRKLPHIHPPGAILFVTFRLTGSIPKNVVERWKAEKTWLEQQLKRVSNEVVESATVEALNHQARLNSFHRRWFREYEKILDKADHGPTWLRDKRVARSIADSLEYRWKGLSARCLLHHV